MRILIIILSALLLISIIVGICYLSLYLKVLNLLIKDYKDEPHFCNYCKKAYIHSKEERARTTCEKCGRTLELHKEHPNYIPKNYKTLSNSDNPFQEFNDKN